MTTKAATVPVGGARGLDEVLAASKAANRHPLPGAGSEHGVLVSYQ